MLTKEFPSSDSRELPSGVRQLAAVTLRAASRSLAALARRVGRVRRGRARMDPVLEFYAEAGAPEGALYVDGKLVGWIPGVNRL